MISGTFFTGEIHIAIEKGYTIERIYEAWLWPKERQTKNLFKSLIGDQYIQKATASKLPTNWEERDTFINELNKEFNVDLVEEDFKPDPTIRALAKLVLNSIWGYLGRRGDVTSTKFIKSNNELASIECDPNIEITDVSLMADPSIAMINYKPISEILQPKQSLILALLTTAYARISLYNILDKYSKYIMYFDTDSVFIYLPDTVTPPESSTKLGQLKDEILEKYGSNATITSFMSTGPKSYQYMLVCFY